MMIIPTTSQNICRFKRSCIVHIFTQPKGCKAKCVKNCCLKKLNFARLSRRAESLITFTWGGGGRGADKEFVTAAPPKVQRRLLSCCPPKSVPHIVMISSFSSSTCSILSPWSLLLTCLWRACDAPKQKTNLHPPLDHPHNPLRQPSLISPILPPVAIGGQTTFLILTNFTQTDLKEGSAKVLIVQTLAGINFAN